MTTFQPYPEAWVDASKPKLDQLRQRIKETQEQFDDAVGNDDFGAAYRLEATLKVLVWVRDALF